MKVALILFLGLQCFSVTHGVQHSFTRPELLSNLREALEGARLKTGSTGMSVAVIHKGKLIFAEGFGKRNQHEPFTPETVMPIGSLSKSFTAAAIGELVAEGKMDWDTTPVSKYLPEFQLHDRLLTSQVTIQDLLSHRTGILNDAIPWMWTLESKSILIERLRYIESDSKLRSDTMYSNNMYAVAGEAAANVAGMPYENLVAEKIFKPLGLSNIGFSTPEMSKRYRNFAMPYTAESFEDAQNGRYIELPLEDMTPADQAAGGIHTNVLELARWGQTVMRLGEMDGRQVLNKDSVIEGLSGHSIFRKYRSTSDFSPSSAYGFAWLLDTYKGNIMYQHTGHVIGYKSNMVIFPDSELVVAFLLNAEFSSLLHVPFYIADELLGLPKTQDWIGDLAVNATKQNFDDIESLAKGDFPPRIENKPPSHELEDMVGEYSSLVNGNISISLVRSEGVGMLHIKLAAFDGVLEHYHYDSFSTSLSHAGFKIGVLVSFVTGQDGKIEGLNLPGKIEGLNLPGTSESDKFKKISK
ncbi:beta-lactamase/transpeptidase-like protein [Dissophora ornata]|nr:hypothetical protein BGZ58_009951 [Dissophora ornata]KAI8597816.1 beta-lactamase/transpeptidase-like protein [Dissophora ornata]